MTHAQVIGCVDHLDASHDAGAFWYDALNDPPALAGERGA